MNWWFRQKLHIQIAVCIVLGVLVGLTLGDKASIIFPIGDIFLRLLKMLIVPLTICTLISGVIAMEDIKNLRSVGGRIVGYYGISSLVAAAIGMVVAIIVNPGKEIVGLLSKGAEIEVAEFSFVDNIVGYVPDNIFNAMANTNMLQIIFFAVFTGIILLMLGDKVKNVNIIIGEATDIMLKMTELVMKFAPYGILALIAKMVSSMGALMLKEVGRFIITDYIGLLIVVFVMYPPLLKFIGKINPIKFFKAISPAMLVAASTTSSSATLPMSMKVAEQSLKLPEKIYGFALPLGATVNMNGMAVVLGVIAVFACNIYDIPLTFGLMVQFIFLGLVLSAGAAGVKGAGIVMSTILLESLNLPLDLVPILAAIWPLIDIGHTTVNITGDLVGTAIVAARLGEMDVEEFNNSKLADLA